MRGWAQQTHHPIVATKWVYSNAAAAAETPATNANNGPRAPGPTGSYCRSSYQDNKVYITRWVPHEMTEYPQKIQQAYKDYLVKHYGLPTYTFTGCMNVTQQYHDTQIREDRLSSRTVIETDFKYGSEP